MWLVRWGRRTLLGQRLPVPRGPEPLTRADGLVSELIERVVAHWGSSAPVRFAEPAAEFRIVLRFRFMWSRVHWIYLDRCPPHMARNAGSERPAGTEQIGKTLQDQPGPNPPQALGPSHAGARCPWVSTRCRGFCLAPITVGALIQKPLRPGQGP